MFSTLLGILNFDNGSKPECFDRPSMKNDALLQLLGLSSGIFLFALAGWSCRP
jgi:hypothetical protein